MSTATMQRPHHSVSVDERLAGVDVEKLVGDINARGYARVANFVAPEALQRMRGFCEDAVKSAGGRYVHFVGAPAVAGSGLEELGASARFRAFIERIYQLGGGPPRPPRDFYFVLRCLTGVDTAKHSLNFHYDSYVVTALIPVAIPEGDSRPNGAFLLSPNTRALRRSYVTNLVEKIFLDNRLSLAALAFVYERRPNWFVRVELTPGDLYVFWGCRSLHTNEPCDPRALRATALFHYGDPHAGSWLKRLLRR